MARIPLSEIPNSPQGVAPVLSSYPNWQANFSGAAGMMQSPGVKGIDGGAYLAAGEGLKSVAKGVASAGYGMGQLGEQALQAQNVISLAQADNMMSDYMAKKQGEFQTLPPDKWNSHFQDGLPGLQSELDKLTLSPNARDAVAANYLRWSGRSAANVGFEATKQAVANGRESVNVAMTRAFKEGDMGTYVALGNSAVKSGLITQAELDGGTYDLQIKQRDDAIQATAISNPWELKTEMDEAAKNGGKSAFGDLQMVEVQKWRRAAATESRNQEIEGFQDIQNAILTNDVTTPEQIQQMADAAHLSPGKVKSLNSFLVKEVDFDPELFEKTNAAVLAYDATTDKDGSKFHELNETIMNQIPKKEGGLLSSALFNSWQQTVREGKSKDADSSLRGGLHKMTNDLGDDGLLGNNGKDKKGKIIDAAAHSAVWEKATTINKKMDAWLDANPTDAKDPHKVRAAWLDLVDSDARNNAAKIFDAAPPHPVSQMSYDPYSNLFWPAKTTNQLVDENLVSSVKEIEGFKDKAYDDFHQTSIGYGTRATGKDEQIDEPTADRRLRGELTQSAKRIDRAASDGGYRLTPGQRNALISFDYNTGRGPFLLETSGGDVAKIRERMGKYVYAGGEVREGLSERRRKEIALFDK